MVAVDLSLMKFRSYNPVPSWAVRLLLLFVFAAGAPRLVPVAASQVAPAAAGGRGMQFAVDDFDGDKLPDFASVQPGPEDASSIGNYWVHLRLSASGGRYIRLTGPKGGLSVEARDVNGDHRVDLVFATAWRSQPVAILLNDGHGNFSQVDPSAFTHAHARGALGFQSLPGLSPEALGNREESTTLAALPARGAVDFEAESDSRRASADLLLADPLLIFRAGRAPPLTTRL